MCYPYRVIKKVKLFVLAGVLLLALLAPGEAVTAETPAPPLDVLVGSMIMCGFRGATLPPDDHFLRLLARGHVGHVILFDRDVSTGKPRNIISRTQVTALTRTLRAAAGRPLFIAVDQEGGRVCRLKPEHGFLPMPSARAMGLGAVEDELHWNGDDIYELAMRVGEDMRAVGINVDFAPVADVAAGPPSIIGRQERSFGGNAIHVALNVAAFAGGLMNAGVIPVLKHFPGIGCATDDTHFSRVDIAACFNEKRDLLPFVEAFRHGWRRGRRGMVMVGHVHTGMDSTHPASLSPVVINGLLRQRLGWEGVVISDDMQMQAITEHYPLEQAIRLAVEAGVDILLFGNNLNWRPHMAEEAHAALFNLVQSGVIPRERVLTSYRRIQALLATVGQ